MATGDLVAGIDLGGTAIKCALATQDGSIIVESQIPTNSHEGPAGVLDRIANEVRRMAERAAAKPSSVGIGVPGLVDIATGTTRFLPNLPTQWREVRVAEILSRQLSCPVRLLNDARSATLGELTFGHGRTARTMAFFSIGTGVGGGVAIDGRLRLGPLGAAGELGHQTIVADGPRCGCGNRGCLETLVSGPAFTAEGVRLMRSGLAPKLFEIVDGDVARISPKELAAAAEAGDEYVQHSIARLAGFLGIGVANVVAILHPDLIVLGGGVAEMGTLLTEPVGEAVRRRVGMFPTDDVRVETSLLRDKAGLMGAIALASLETIDGSHESS